MNKNNIKKEKQKKPIQILRERIGGVPKALTNKHREQRKIRKDILETLKEGSKTVPEIANQTGLQSHLVLWYITGMKKYGQIIEAEECEGYYKYALKENNKENQE